MTALTQYDRIEASALWREHGADQRREVIVSLGDTSLVITDLQERPLSHWSLSAVQRVNPGQVPAVFSPDGDTDETIELDASETAMIQAIETLCAVIDRRRPKPGRLRTVSFVGSFLVVIMGLLLWMPVAVRDYTLRVLPSVTRTEIGRQIAQQLVPYTGPECFSPLATPAVRTLQTRYLGDGAVLRIVPQGVVTVLALPGQIFLAQRGLVEDYEDPDVLAGYLLAEKTRVKDMDLMHDVLSELGLGATFQLLTTGTLDAKDLADYAQGLLSRPIGTADTERLIAAFQNNNLRMMPYALAVDITGETTFPFLEADTLRDDITRPSLGDSAWVSLQGICGG